MLNFEDDDYNIEEYIEDSITEKKVKRLLEELATHVFAMPMEELLRWMPESKIKKDGNNHYFYYGYTPYFYYSEITDKIRKCNADFNHKIRVIGSELSEDLLNRIDRKDFYVTDHSLHEYGIQNQHS